MQIPLITHTLILIITNLYIHRFLMNIRFDLDSVLGMGNTAVSRHIKSLKGLIL